MDSDYLSGLTTKDRRTCYACERAFADSGGHPTIQRHAHHIIPRAYGGADGPLTQVCLPCHDLLHKVANKMIHGKSYFHMLPSDPDYRGRLLFLSTRILTAHNYAAGDVNKSSPLVVKLDPRTKSMLEELKVAFKARGAEALIVRLIQSAHSSTFPKR
jgi:hypothetical protein